MSEPLILLLIVVGWILASVIGLKLYVPVKNWFISWRFDRLWAKSEKQVEKDLKDPSDSN